MKHHVFEESNSYSTAVLIKATAFNKQELQTNYIHTLKTQGVPANDVIAFTLAYKDDGKAPNGFIKEYLDGLLPELNTLGIKYLYVADANYFKVLAGQTKAEPHYGYVLPCKVKGFEHMQVVLGLNHHALIYNPALQNKLDMSLATLSSYIQGNHTTLGAGIIHSAQYPEGIQAIAAALESLHQYPSLTADIEAFSLRFNEAGIGTISFAWDKNNGLAFACDYHVVPEDHSAKDIAGLDGYQFRNPEVRALLKNFLTNYKGEITWHNAAYDLKAIIYTLWMKDGLDNEGMLAGLEVPR